MVIALGAMSETQPPQGIPDHIKDNAKARLDGMIVALAWVLDMNLPQHHSEWFEKVLNAADEALAKKEKRQRRQRRRKKRISRDSFCE